MRGEELKAAGGIIEDVKNLIDYCDLEWVVVPKVESASSPVSESAERSRREQLDELRARIGDCRLCRLHEGRTHLVFGVGNPDAELVFVGEGPGRDEDLQGEPFVGAAGQLLTKIIEAMGFKRSDVYICNVVKCRPPNNRVPQGDEMETCRPFLMAQLDIIRPKVIVALGATAIKGLLQTDEKISAIRGRFQQINGIPVMPTFHPAYLLRNPGDKRLVWEDMKAVLKALRRPVPEKEAKEK